MAASAACTRFKRFREMQGCALPTRRQCVIAHHRPCTDARGDGPAGGVHAVEGRPTAFRGDPTVLNLPPLFEIDDGEIGVVAERDATFAGDSEDARSARAGEID